MILCTRQRLQLAGPMLCIWKAMATRQGTYTCTICDRSVTKQGQAIRRTPILDLLLPVMSLERQGLQQTTLRLRKRLQHERAARQAQVQAVLSGWMQLVERCCLCEGTCTGKA